MTVETTTNKARYVGNAAATTWSYTFEIPTVDELEVYYTDLAGVTTLLSLSDYSVTGIGTTDGGIVTYPLSVSPIAAGTILTILRVLPYTQNIDLVNQDGFYAQVVEDGLDYLEMQIQQLVEVQGRNLTVDVSDTSPGALPAAAARANQLLGFDSAGDAVAAQPSSALVSTAMQPVVNAATIAAAIALMGLAPIPSGLECDYAGLVAPSGWYLEYGQAIVRATDTALLAAIAPTLGCVITNTSTSVTGLASTAGFYLGMPIESAAFPAGTIVSSGLTSTTFTASAAATANGVVLQAFPFGNGNGTTTFNLPDGRGYAYAGRDDMGGTAANRLTTAVSINGAGLSVSGGSQSHTLLQTELPAFKPDITITDPGHTHVLSATRSYTGSAPPDTYVSVTAAASAASFSSNSRTTGVTAALTDNLGSATPLAIVQPTSIRNKIIKR